MRVTAHSVPPILASGHLAGKLRQIKVWKNIRQSTDRSFGVFSTRFVEAGRRPRLPPEPDG